ncbi:UNVERIFIED_CONTAM: formamidopyrimidine-DNA glycosylase, partial [Salmonella enterica subsp. enterica serovar Weltevreden]
VRDRGVLRVRGPRRLGAVVWLDSLEAPWARKRLDGWGVEPLSADFTPAVLLQGLRNSRTSVKQLLLSGSVVVGVGNIYACEATFMAGLRP